jgi:phytoene dehydrogenase-like protein
LGQIGLKDLESHIKFEITFTPPLWERSLNLSQGAVFGSLDHSLLQVGYFRPANQHPHYTNLFFVGGSTHPGSGVPLTLLGARLAAERIFHAHGLPCPAAWRKLEF